MMMMIIIIIIIASLLRPIRPTHSNRWMKNHDLAAATPTNSLCKKQRAARAASGGGQVASAMMQEKALIHSKVFGIGLPHSGTTTLSKHLLTLGCCYNNHNLEQSKADLFWTWDWTQKRGGKSCLSHLAECKQALRRELKHFQCVSDNPWASEGIWQKITTETDESSYVILTRAMSPAHYAMTVRFWAERNRKVYTIDKDYNSTEALVARYKAHLANVRHLHSRNPRYIEICFACGDDIWTLARSMQLNMSKVSHILGSGYGASRAANSHPESENKKRLEFLRAHVADLGRK
jgi:hypothetical protein